MKNNTAFANIDKKVVSDFAQKKKEAILARRAEAREKFNELKQEHINARKKSFIFRKFRSDWSDEKIWNHLKDTLLDWYEGDEELIKYENISANHAGQQLELCERLIKLCAASDEDTILINDKAYNLITL